MFTLRRHLLTRSVAIAAYRGRWRLATLLVLGALTLPACADLGTQPNVQDIDASRTRADAEWHPILAPSPLLDREWERLSAVEALPGPARASASLAISAPLAEPAVLRWNALARELVASFHENPPRAARAYTLVSVAQYDALVALRRYRHPAPGRDAAGAVSGGGSGPAPLVERAAIAGASSEVLGALFPAAKHRLTTEAEADLAFGNDRNRHLAAAYALGRGVGQRVLEYAASDGSDAVWSGEVPVGPGLWYSSADPVRPPLLPLWGAVRPWLMASRDQFLPPPPPAFGSPEFLAALAEVRQISDTRTPEQRRIALYWADDPGTATPPGHWNQIASDLILRHRFPEIRAAWTLALLNMALMDASISCWHAKYVYWLIRPSQVDPRITTPVPLPNFPSYTSGHATFSGAAGEFLGAVFPAEREELRTLAEEAAMSRVYGGIHYRFDSDRGLEAGRAIGQLAIERGRRLTPRTR